MVVFRLCIRNLTVNRTWWLAFFLIHPLVTALAFIPITPAGIGVQEFGIVGILGLLGVAAPIAGVFALLARGLLIFEDLAGVPQIVKSTSLIFSHKKSEDSPLNRQTCQSPPYKPSFSRLNRLTNRFYIFFRKEPLFWTST